MDVVDISKLIPYSSYKSRVAAALTSDPSRLKNLIWSHNLFQIINLAFICNCPPSNAIKVFEYIINRINNVDSKDIIRIIVMLTITIDHIDSVVKMTNILYALEKIKNEEKTKVFMWIFHHFRPHEINNDYYNRHRSIYQIIVAALIMLDDEFVKTRTIFYKKRETTQKKHVYNYTFSLKQLVEFVVYKNVQLDNVKYINIYKKIMIANPEAYEIFISIERIRNEFGNDIHKEYKNRTLLSNSCRIDTFYISLIRYYYPLEISVNQSVPIICPRKIVRKYIPIIGTPLIKTDKFIPSCAIIANNNQELVVKKYIVLNEMNKNFGYPMHESLWQIHLDKTSAIKKIMKMTNEDIAFVSTFSKLRMGVMSFYFKEYLSENFLPMWNMYGEFEWVNRLRINHIETKEALIIRNISKNYYTFCMNNRMHCLAIFPQFTIPFSPKTFACDARKIDFLLNFDKESDFRITTIIPNELQEPIGLFLFGKYPKVFAHFVKHKVLTGHSIETLLIAQECINSQYAKEEYAANMIQKFIKKYLQRKKKMNKTKYTPPKEKYYIAPN